MPIGCAYRFLPPHRGHSYLKEIRPRKEGIIDSSDLRHFYPCGLPQEVFHYPETKV